MSENPLSAVFDKPWVRCAILFKYAWTHAETTVENIYIYINISHDIVQASIKGPLKTWILYTKRWKSGRAHGQVSANATDMHAHLIYGYTNPLTCKNTSRTRYKNSVIYLIVNSLRLWPTNVQIRTIIQTKAKNVWRTVAWVYRIIILTLSLKYMIQKWTERHFHAAAPNIFPAVVKTTAICTGGSTNASVSAVCYIKQGVPFKEFSHLEGFGALSNTLEPGCSGADRCCPSNRTKTTKTCKVNYRWMGFKFRSTADKRISLPSIQMTCFASFWEVRARWRKLRGLR